VICVATIDAIFWTAIAVIAAGAVWFVVGELREIFRK
jgi:hypothetical protein